MSNVLMWGLSLLMLSASANAGVWETRNQWNDAWQKRYQEYVKTWGTDFFARTYLPDGRPNPYYGIRTDCADTVYSFHAIFAYENGLPLAFNDGTGGGGLITNEMSRFNSISDPLKRFRAFLNFMYDTVATETMYMDTYPIAINGEAIHSGVILKTTPKNHHSWTVKNILSIGVPDLVFNSTIGASTGSTLQERQSWPNPDWVFEGNDTPAGTAGFRDWRPAAYLKSAVWEVPGYSEEQYHIPLSKWVQVATQRLAIQRETDAAKLQRLADNACVELTSRVASVRDGVNFLSKTGPVCMNAEDYDTYSTPSRDQRFFDALADLRRAYHSIVTGGKASALNSKIVAQMNKIFPMASARAADEAARMSAQGITGDSMCITSYASNRSIDLAEAKHRMFAGLMSNNPNDGLAYRWGELRGPSPLAASCQSWDVWTPNLNQAD